MRSEIPTSDKPLGDARTAVPWTTLGVTRTYNFPLYPSTTCCLFRVPFSQASTQGLVILRDY